MTVGPAVQIALMLRSMVQHSTPTPMTVPKDACGNAPSIPLSTEITRPIPVLKNVPISATVTMIPDYAWKPVTLALSSTESKNIPTPRIKPIFAFIDALQVAGRTILPLHASANAARAISQITQHGSVY